MPGIRNQTSFGWKAGCGMYEPIVKDQLPVLKVVNKSNISRCTVKVHSCYSNIEINNTCASTTTLLIRKTLMQDNER